MLIQTTAAVYANTDNNPRFNMLIQTATTVYAQTDTQYCLCLHTQPVEFILKPKTSTVYADKHLRILSAALMASRVAVSVTLVWRHASPGITGDPGYLHPVAVPFLQGYGNSTLSALSGNSMECGHP